MFLLDKVTKVLISILSVLIILLIGYFSYIFLQNNDDEKNSGLSENKLEQNIVNENELEENREKQEQNTIDGENTTNSEDALNSSKNANVPQNNNTNQKTVKNNTTEVIGKEEQESNNESNGINPDETAIKLAKEKWGETSKNYVFNVDQIEGNIYHIAVISNAQVIGYVDVNIDTKTAVER